jgi:hypothetical protein
MLSKRNWSPRPCAIIFWTLATVATVLAVPLNSSAQASTAQDSPAHDSTRRLILKDGSYQTVTKYEIKEDRVRYYSAERDEWEELPKSLVDWPATEKYEAEEREKDRGTAASAVQLDKQIENENESAQAKLPEVAPGLRLPRDSGVFLLDNLKSEPQLVEVQEAEGDLNQSSKGNIFHGGIAKQSVELAGEHAKVQSHVDIPSFYINLEAPPAAAPPQDPQSPQAAAVPFDRFRIVRADAKAGKRTLAEVKRGLTGKMTQDQHFEKTTTTRMTGGWLKLTPAQNLAPGEYAVVEMMDKEGMNLYVWDFGVNPNAPENASPWKPETKEAPKPQEPEKP